jgi:hypothetical protein
LPPLEPRVTSAEAEAAQLEAEGRQYLALAQVRFQRAAEVRGGAQAGEARAADVDVGERHVGDGERDVLDDAAAAGPVARPAAPVPHQVALLPALLSASEAALFLGLSVAALRKRAQRSQLPRGAVVQVGRRYQFRRDRLLPPERL